VSDRRSSADLGVNAETALASFPFPERDWEQNARAIEARVTASSREETDDALLGAPLPSEPGEPSTFSATATPLTSSGVRTQSLAEIARRSVQQKQAAEREMARASFALAAQARPSAEEAAALREAVSSVRAVAAPPAPPTAPAKAKAEVPAVAATTRSESPWSKLGAAAGVLALAAMAMLWLRKPEPAPPAPLAAAPAPKAAEAPAATAMLEAKPTQAPAAATAIDPSSLSTEAVAAKPAGDNAHAKAAGGPALAAAEKAAASAPAPGGPNPENIVLEDDKPSAPVAAVEKPAEKPLPPDPELRPADSTGGAIPVKPSTGAVQAALGAVMSGARHCVAGDEAPSSAVVVFGSDGRVQNVTVSGPAAGKPSGTCIQSQLSRARVQPFASATFSINATVRPD